MPAVDNATLPHLKVSVVIPAYNAEKTLGLCLEAFSRQTYPRDLFQVIVVDDGSTDRTGDIARRFPVQTLHEKNQGPATARNYGAAAGDGDILLFTDADCIPSDNWIEEMVAPFQRKEVIAVKGAYRSRQPEIVARFVQIEFEERFELLEKAGKTDMVDTYSAGYRYHIFLELGGFNTRFPVANNEDTELSYRLAAKGLQMVFNPRAIVYHLGHPNSVMRYARLKYYRGYWRMAVYRRFPNKMMNETYTPKSLKVQIFALFLFLGVFPTPFVLAVPGLLLMLAAALLFGVSIMPFVIRALRKDPVVGLFTPFLLTTRAAALGAGVLWGSLRAHL